MNGKQAKRLRNLARGGNPLQRDGRLYRGVQLRNAQGKVTRVTVVNSGARAEYRFLKKSYTQGG